VNDIELGKLVERVAQLDAALEKEKLENDKRFERVKELCILLVACRAGRGSTRRNWVETLEGWL